MRFLEMNFNNLKDDNMKVFLFYVHILQQILLVVKVTIVITFVINFSDAITFPSVSFVVFKNLLLWFYNVALHFYETYINIYEDFILIWKYSVQHNLLV